MHRSFLGKLPESHSIKDFVSPEETLRTMERLVLGPRGEQSIVVRRFTEQVVGYLWPKCYLSEILAIRNVLLQPSINDPTIAMFRYTNDPRHVEWIKDPQRQVEEIIEHGTTAVDCDEQSVMIATMGLQLGREVKFVALGYGSGSDLTHVGVSIREPKSSEWIWIDPVAGPRERDSAATATAIMEWSLD